MLNKQSYLTVEQVKDREAQEIENMREKRALIEEDRKHRARLSNAHIMKRITDSVETNDQTYNVNNTMASHRDVP